VNVLCCCPVRYGLVRRKRRRGGERVGSMMTVMDQGASKSKKDYMDDRAMRAVEERKREEVKVGLDARCRDSMPWVFIQGGSWGDNQTPFCVPRPKKKRRRNINQGSSNGESGGEPEDLNHRKDKESQGSATRQRICVSRRRLSFVQDASGGGGSGGGGTAAGTAKTVVKQRWAI